jgi:hypothetical protein
MTTPISYIICIQCKILSVNVLPKKVVVVSPDVLLYHFGGYCLSDENASCIPYKRLDVRQGYKIVDKTLEDTYVFDNDVMPRCLSFLILYQQLYRMEIGNMVHVSHLMIYILYSRYYMKFKTGLIMNGS